MYFKDSSVDENGFTFNWKVKNFSLCSLSEGSYLASPSFKVENIFNTEWELRLYTNFHNHNSDVTLNLVRLMDDGPSDKVGLDVKLFIAKRRGERITDDKPNKKFGRGYQLAEPLKIARRSLFEECDLLILEDTLTVGCNLINNAEDTHRKLVCNASTEVTAERFLLSIPVAFSKSIVQPMQYITIPLTSSSKNYPDFKVKLEPRGFTVNTRILMGRSSVPILSECKMEFKGTKSDVICSFKGGYIFVAEQDSQTWEISSLEFSNRWEVCDYLDMIVFMLHFELSVSDGTTHSVFENNVYCPHTLDDKTTPSCPSKSSAEEKLRCLRTDKRFCDFVFRVDGKDFPVHKAILSLASPVFYAMFDRDMREKASSETVIEDIETTTMECLIDFVYTNVIENLHQDNAVKLYSAADKYQILELKQICAEFINSNLSIKNVTEVMSMADMYQDDSMKKAAVSFAYANSKEVFSSEQWKTFIENNVNLAAKSMHEICLKMTEQFWFFNHSNQ